MPSKQSKPKPDIAASEASRQGTLTHGADALQEADVRFREMGKRIQAQERRTASRSVSPARPSGPTKLEQSLAATSDAVARSRASRAPHPHRPDGVAGGDAKRIAVIAELVLEMEREGEVFEHEVQRLEANAHQWEKMAALAIKANDDALAREALARRRECLDSVGPLRREVELTRRICSEYKGLLDALRRIEDS